MFIVTYSLALVCVVAESSSCTDTITENGKCQTISLAQKTVLPRPKYATVRRTIRGKKKLSPLYLSSRIENYVDHRKAENQCNSISMEYPVGAIQQCPTTLKGTGGVDCSSEVGLAHKYEQGGRGAPVVGLKLSVPQLFFSVEKVRRPIGAATGIPTRALEGKVPDIIYGRDRRDKQHGSGFDAPCQPWFAILPKIFPNRRHFDPVAKIQLGGWQHKRLARCRNRWGPCMSAQK